MRYIKTILTLALIASLTACGNTQTPNEVSETSLTSGEAVVTSTRSVSETEAIEEITMESEGFFMPCTNGSYLLIRDDYGAMQISPHNGDNSIFAEFTIGDRVKAVHGLILETYPSMTTFYSIEKLSEGDISDISAETLYDLEEMGWIAISNNSETVQTDETTPTLTPTVLDRETDRRIRSDYAAFVSARDNKDITIDQVTVQFYYGDDNGYMLLVMCPSNSFTEEIKEYTLPIMDIPDEDCDCYPYVEVTLPSGMFELLAYKDGTFTDIETAVNEKLISYEADSDIVAYMDKLYSEGDQTCVYKTNYIDD